MSDTFGALYIQGQQLNLPGGQQSIGPWAVPCSGLQYTVPVVLNNNSIATETPDVTEGYAFNAAGVLIIPPAGGTVEYWFKINPSDHTIYLSPAYPSFIAFDPAEIPANVILGSSGIVTVNLQFV